MNKLLLPLIFAFTFAGNELAAQSRNNETTRQSIERKFFQVLAQKLASNELTLTEHQDAEINQIIDNVLNETIDFRNMPHKVVQEHRDKVRKRAISLTADVLLPHQMEEVEIRSVQLVVVQENFRNTLPENYLLSSKVFREILELTDSQINSLDELGDETTKQLAENSNEFHKSYENIFATPKKKIRNELNPEQRGLWDKTTGERFDFFNNSTDQEQNNYFRRLNIKLQKLKAGQVDGDSTIDRLSELGNRLNTTWYDKLIFKPLIQAELELSKEQIEAINKIKSAWEKSELEFYDQEEIARSVGLDELLPHQEERIYQLILQAHVYHFFLLSEIQIEVVEEAIDLDQEQREAISKILHECEAELMDKFSEFNLKQEKAVEAANLQMFKALKPLQQQIYLRHFKSPSPED